jgi:DNA-binding XRE family transcriptional regulator
MNPRREIKTQKGGEAYDKMVTGTHHRGDRDSDSGSNVHPHGHQRRENRQAQTHEAKAAAVIRRHRGAKAPRVSTKIIRKKDEVCKYSTMCGVRRFRSDTHRHNIKGVVRGSVCPLGSKRRLSPPDRQEATMSKLQDQRKAAKLTQGGLAEKSGVSALMIRKYEQGVKDINRAAVITVKALADTLGCRIEDLIEQ